MDERRSGPPPSRLIALFALAALTLAACAGTTPQPAAAPRSAAPTPVPVVASTAPSPTAAHAAPTDRPDGTASPTAAAAPPGTSVPTAVVAPAATAAALTPTPPQVSATAAPATAKPIAPTGVPGPLTTVAVTLSDSAIKLAQAAAPGGTVTFAISNRGSVTHELVVLKTDQPQDHLPADPTKPAEVQEPGYLGKVQLLAPGGSGALTLSLGPGSYVLICNQPAHYLIGMHASFTVN